MATFQPHRRRLVVAVTDPHGANVQGLYNPETVLKVANVKTGDMQRWYPILNDFQEYIWRLYITYIDKVAEFADGDPIILIFLGDLMSGEKYKEELMAGLTPRDQELIGAWIIRPWLEHPKLNISHLRLVRGTPAHTGNGVFETNAMVEVATWYPDLDIRILHHALIKVSGIGYDLAHHGPHPGSRKWLEGNVARYYLRSRMWSAYANGWEVPRVYVRGHRHVPVWETLHERLGDTYKTSDIYVIPSFCGMSGFARKVTMSVEELTNGLAAWEIREGKLWGVRTYYRTLDLRTQENL